MGPLASTDPGILAAFTATSLLAAAGAVFVSGFMPLDARPAAVRGTIGAVLVVLGGAVTLGLGAAAVVAALGSIHWAVAVVAAGSAFLLAPFVVQPLPERLRDTKTGLALFSLLGLGALGGLAAANAF